MKILITGHTGFKGTWFSFLLSNLGYELFGFSDIILKNSLFDISLGNKLFKKSILGDVRDFDSLNNFISSIKPEVVVHFAAQPLVLKSYEKQFDTYQINVAGTLNVLESVERSDFCKKVLVITSDKVYRNNSQSHFFEENDELGGFDPYSNSKAMADLLSQSWKFKDKNKKVIIARAGNVIGAGDISDNRIVPDIFRALTSDSTLMIRNPNAIRPWQYVLDCLYGYLKLIEKIDLLPANSTWNFGPNLEESISVEQIVKIFQKHFPKLQVQYNKINSDKYEMSNLLINSNKSRNNLNWTPKFTIEETIFEISSWISKFIGGSDPFELNQNAINVFLKKS